jgi:hypothetical protein
MTPLLPLLIPSSDYQISDHPTCFQEQYISQQRHGHFLKLRDLNDPPEIAMEWLGVRLVFGFRIPLGFSDEKSHIKPLRFW